jgi:hypothetical protein
MVASVFESAIPVGEKVTHRAQLHIQRKCACETHSASSGDCESCRKDRGVGTLQRSTHGHGSVSSIPPAVHDVIQSPGQALDNSTRNDMERRLGADFSGVRVHTDSRAAESARAIHARAYTAGRSIVFDSGKFDPASSSGRHLLAHELTHVMQQSHASSTPNRISDPSEAAEREADAVAGGLDTGKARPGGFLGVKPAVFRMPATAQPAKQKGNSAKSPNDCKAANRFQTNREHRIIQADYVTRQNPGAVKEYQIPESSQWGNTGWADLADESALTLYEIKSFWEWGRGAAEVARYIQMARRHCGDGWLGGRDYIPTAFEDPDDPKNVLLAARASPGLILYQWFRRQRKKDKLPQRFQRQVEIPKKERRGTTAEVPDGVSTADPAITPEGPAPTGPVTKPDESEEPLPDNVRPIRPGIKPGKQPQPDQQEQPGQIPQAAKVPPKEKSVKDRLAPLIWILEALGATLVGRAILARVAKALAGSVRRGGPILAIVQAVALAAVIVLSERQAKAGENKIDDDPLVALAQMLDDTGKPMPPEIRKLLEEHPELRELVRLEVERRRRAGTGTSGATGTATKPGTGQSSEGSTVPPVIGGQSERGSTGTPSGGTSKDGKPATNQRDATPSSEGGAAKDQKDGTSGAPTQDYWAAAKEALNATETLATKSGQASLDADLSIVPDGKTIVTWAFQRSGDLRSVWLVKLKVLKQSDTETTIQIEWCGGMLLRGAGAEDVRRPAPAPYLPGRVLVNRHPGK